MWLQLGLEKQLALQLISQLPRRVQCRRCQPLPPPLPLLQRAPAGDTLPGRARRAGLTLGPGPPLGSSLPADARRGRRPVLRAGRGHEAVHPQHAFVLLQRG